MIIKAQDGKEYDIFIVSTRCECVYCQDNTDRRRKRLLGKYKNIEKATKVFDQIIRCVDGYFQMPKDSEV